MSTLPSAAAPQHTSRPLYVVLDGNYHEIDPRLTFPDARVDLTKALVDARDVDFSLSGILRFDEYERTNLMRFLAEAVVDAKMRGGDALFACVLGLDPGTSLTDFAWWQGMMIILAATLYPAAMDAACQRIADQARARGVSGVRVDVLRRQAREYRRHVEKANGANTHRPRMIPSGVADIVKTTWTDAPVPDNVVFPAGARAGPANLVIDGRGGPYDLAPLVVTAIEREETSGRLAVELAYRTSSKWIRRSVSREQVADSRQIISLAAFGFPIHSSNAKAIVEYVAEFEALNAAALSHTRITSRMGWHDQQTQFVLGRVTLTRAGGADAAIKFRGVDDGAEQLADGFRAGGTLNGWLAMATQARMYPTAWFVLMAAFVPPILRLVGSSNFAVDVAGPTTTGKSTTLRLAASAWGDPSGGGSSILRTWDSTAVWRDRAPGFLQGLPLILDESKVAGDPTAISRTVYGIVNGTGRGRGTIGGVAPSTTFETVLFSSGEQPIVRMVNDGGLRGRVVMLTAPPFGAVSDAAAQIVSQLGAEARTHFGHAGPAFVQYLLDHTVLHATWQQEFRDVAAQYHRRAGANHLLGRLAEPLAAVAVASKILHAALAFSWPWTDPVAKVWDDLAAPTVIDAPAEAFLVAYEAAVANRERFTCCDTLGSSHVVEAWGRWNDHQSQGFPRPKRQLADGWVGYLEEPLRKVLRAAGHEYGEVAPAWKQRGWLHTDHDGRNKLKTEIAGKPVRVIALRLDVLPQLQGEGDTKTDVTPRAAAM